MDASWATFAELGGLLLVAVLTPNLNFFMPIRPTLLAMLLAQHQPWFAVGAIAAIGGVIGVLPLYGIAYRATDTRIVQRWLRYRPVRWVLERLKKRTFLLILLLVLTPLPDQLIGIAAGAERYSLRRFLGANLLGRSLVYLPLAYLASRHAVVVTDVWTWLIHLVSI